jgi:hypothetical protein
MAYVPEDWVDGLSLDDLAGFIGDATKRHAATPYVVVNQCPRAGGGAFTVQSVGARRRRDKRAEPGPGNDAIGAFG